MTFIQFPSISPAPFSQGDITRKRKDPDAETTTDLHRQKHQKVSHGGLLSRFPYHHPDQFRLQRGPFNPDTQVIESQQTVEVLTRALADRQTLRLVLPNGLKCYLVSDPNLNESGAAVAVQRGHFDEPTEFPGLAHFLEHELFLGTKSYPDESGFDKFLQENGGMSNAFTTDTRTCYYFSLRRPEGFKEAIDRFSGFFREPLFSPSGIEREMHAVDQEYSANRNIDPWRWAMVRGHLANPDHPSHAFYIGNFNTLKDIKQEALLEWHRQNYSADQMYAIVYSTHPLENLRQWVEEGFKDVPTSPVPERARFGPMFAEETKGALIEMQPIQDLQTLTLVFELPCEFAHYFDSKPCDVVAKVLGDESDTSLLAQLKREGLADGFSAGEEMVGADNILFEIEIELTALGLEKRNEVIHRCFQAIAGFRKAGCPQYLFDETKNLAKMAYQFKQDKDVFSQLSIDCHLIHEEDLATYPEKTYIPQEFRPDLVMKLLSHLTPKNCLFFVQDKKLDPSTFNKKEPWMEIDYGYHKIDNEQLQKWTTATPHPAISLPEPNPYIPTQLRLNHEHDTSQIIPIPEKVIDAPGGVLFQAPDTRYMVPKVSSYFHVISAKVVPGDAKSQAVNQLFAHCIREKLNASAYPASAAKLNFQVTSCQQGVDISVRGFDEKAPTLMKDLTALFKKAIPTTEQFESYRDLLVRATESAMKKYPILTAKRVLQELIDPETVPLKTMVEAYKELTYEDLTSFAQDLFKRTYIEGSIYGNVDADTAKAMFGIIQDSLQQNQPYPKSEHVKERVGIFPEDGPHYLQQSVDLHDNAICLALHCGKGDIASRAAWTVLTEALHTPFFEELRTKQQTGYIVGAGGSERENQLFLKFQVQSGQHDPRDLSARIELFIETFLKGMGHEEFSAEKFESLKESVVKELRQPPENLSLMGLILNTLAFERKENFAYHAELADAVEALSFEDFQTMAKEWLGPENKKRIAALVYGKTDPVTSLKYQEASDQKALASQVRYITDTA